MLPVARHVHGASEIYMSFNSISCNVWDMSHVGHATLEGVAWLSAEQDVHSGANKKTWATRWRYCAGSIVAPMCDWVHIGCVSYYEPLWKEAYLHMWCNFSLVSPPIKKKDRPSTGSSHARCGLGLCHQYHQWVEEMFAEWSNIFFLLMFRLPYKLFPNRVWSQIKVDSSNQTPC